MDPYFYDSNKVRYRLAASHDGKPYNWLFFPGGPGADSCYFESLLDIVKLPGNAWLIDLPGSGGNTGNLSAYNFDLWFDIFLPAIERFENAILVGHSFGGMFPLLFPELEKILKGYIILNSAPSLWLEEAVRYAKQFSLPDLTAEMQAFILNPNEETFKVALDACMPYYFPPKTLEKGRGLLSRIPFQYQPAVWWQKKVIDLNFSAKWVPQKIPTVIVGGTYDCICPFTLFQQDGRFKRSNIEMVNIEKGGHCGWIEDPQAFVKLFNEFCNQIE